MVIHASRFQRYQLPAWAHTQESHALEPEPASSLARPLEPKNTEGDAATALCNTGTPVDKSVAVAAHTSVVEKSEETGGNPTPLPTGNGDVDEVADAGCRETPGGAFDVDDIPQFEALRPSHSRVRRQSERGQDVPVASTERSSKRTSKIGKRNKLGDSGAKIRNGVVGWQPGRVEVRGGRILKGALGAREESSGARVGKSTKERLGLQGPGGNWAKSVHKEVSWFGPSSASR